MRRVYVRVCVCVCVRVRVRVCVCVCARARVFAFFQHFSHCVYVHMYVSLQYDIVYPATEVGVCW